MAGRAWAIRQRTERNNVTAQSKHMRMLKPELSVLRGRSSMAVSCVGAGGSSGGASCGRAANRECLDEQIFTEQTHLFMEGAWDVKWVEGCFKSWVNHVTSSVSNGRDKLTWRIPLKRGLQELNSTSNCLMSQLKQLFTLVK